MKSLYRNLLLLALPLLSLVVISGCDDDEADGSYLKPKITSLSAPMGVRGTQIIITGTNLKKVSLVKFGGFPAAGFNPANNTETSITVTVPDDLAPGVVELSVFYPGSSEKNLGPSDRVAFLVLYEPEITEVSPDEGKPGTEVTISGNHLSTATSVKFGATEVLFTASMTKITARVPDVAPANVQLTVTTLGGVASVPFNLLEQLPEIHTVAPLEGDPGTEVTVTGIAFVNVQSVKIGSSVVSDYTVVNQGEISFTVPAGASSGKISITTPKGTFMSSNSFTVTGGAIAYILYDEDLRAGWDKWGWGGGTDWTSTEQKKNGSHSAKKEYTDAWGGFQIHPQSTFSTTGYSALKVSIYGGTNSNGQKVKLFIKPAGGSPVGEKEITLTAGSWIDYTIPLSDLGNPATIDELVIQSVGVTTPMVIYIDDLGLAN